MVRLHAVVDAARVANVGGRENGIPRDGVRAALGRDDRDLNHRARAGAGAGAVRGLELARRQKARGDLIAGRATQTRLGDAEPIRRLLRQRVERVGQVGVEGGCSRDLHVGHRERFAGTGGAGGCVRDARGGDAGGVERPGSGDPLPLPLPPSPPQPSTARDATKKPVNPASSSTRLMRRGSPARDRLSIRDARELTQGGAPSVVA